MNLILKHCTHYIHRMPTATFTSALPRDDAALADALKHAEDVNLLRENVMLQEISRVVRNSSPISLHVSSLSMLKGNDEFVLLNDLRAMPNLKSVYISAQFQKQCFNQIKWLVGFLSCAHNMKNLTLRLMEYPTEEFVKNLPSAPRGMLISFPSMLGIKDSRQTIEDDESRQIANMLIESMRPARIQNGVGSNALENEICKIIQSENAQKMLIDEGNDQLTTQNNHTSLIMGGRKPHFSYISREEYGSVMDHFYSSPLPESLETLKLTCILQGLKDPFLPFFLPGLLHLDLSFCQMDDEAFNTAGYTIGRRLPSLKTLNMCRNRLQNADLAGLLGQSLEEIDLQNNPVSNKGASFLFKGLENNSTLRSANLAYTNITKQVSMKGLQNWLAKPARLILPCIFENHELEVVMGFLPLEAELEMMGNMEHRNEPMLGF